MKQYKICVFLFCMIPLNMAVTDPQELQFQRAFNLIKAIKRITRTKPINYADLHICTETYEGEDKIACRINDGNWNGESTVGFLVCKFKYYGSEPERKECAEIIKTEIKNLKILHEAGVKTVKFREELISSVPCGQNPANSCSGYLVERVDKDRGRFEHIRHRITTRNKATMMMILDVKDFTGKAMTVADLAKIKKYMEVPPEIAIKKGSPETPKYRQICDLQGFFLKAGGFLGADVPEIGEDLGIDGRCWTQDDPNEAPEPTILEVLCALNTMIGELQSPHLLI